MTYAVVLVVGLDAFERAKPVKDLASWVSLNAPDDATITAYQMDRWKTSWRFYADRHLTTAETPDELINVLSQPGTHYAVMQREQFDAMQKKAPQHPMRIVRERRGLSNTSGRGLRKKKEDWPTFVVVTNTPDPAAPVVSTTTDTGAVAEIAPSTARPHMRKPQQRRPLRAPAKPAPARNARSAR